MGDPDQDWCLEVVRGLTREQGISLLDRAAEVGLLSTHGGGYYTIHPALPWYFRDLFERHHPAASGDADRDSHAFVEAIGGFGDYYLNQYIEGNREVLYALAAEEDNLLAAWRLAHDHGWWHRVISAMPGLQMLYWDTGRRAAGRRVGKAIVAEVVDPPSGRPPTGGDRAGAFALRVGPCEAVDGVAFVLAQE